jgi:hypothetical protein
MFAEVRISCCNCAIRLGLGDESDVWDLDDDNANVAVELVTDVVTEHDAS